MNERRWSGFTEAERKFLLDSCEGVPDDDPHHALAERLFYELQDSFGATEDEIDAILQSGIDRPLPESSARRLIRKIAETINPENPDATFDQLWQARQEGLSDRAQTPTKEEPR